MSDPFKGPGISGIIAVLFLLGMLSYKVFEREEEKREYPQEVEDMLSRPLLDYVWPEPSSEEGAGMYNDRFSLRLRI